MQLLNLALVQHLGFLFGHHADVETLVDVDGGTAVDELLQQRSPVLASEDVRVAQDDVLLSAPELRQVGYLVRLAAFLCSHMTERAASRTASRQEPVGGVGDIVERIVRVGVLNLRRQFLHVLVVRLPRLATVDEPE